MIYLVKRTNVSSELTSKKMSTKEISMSTYLSLLRRIDNCQNVLKVIFVCWFFSPLLSQAINKSTTNLRVNRNTVRCVSDCDDVFSNNTPAGSQRNRTTYLKKMTFEEAIALSAKVHANLFSMNNLAVEFTLEKRTRTRLT